MMDRGRVDTQALVAARAYTGRGLAVLPLNGKIPATSNGVKDATAHPAQLAEWFVSERNIGIAIPAGVLIVDIDPRNGGHDTVAGWEAAHGTGWRWDAPTQTTGGGGQHLWFRHPGGKIRKNPGAGVDLLTEGRYVVAAPSITDNKYRWTKPLPDNLDQLPRLPGWLIELARPLEHTPRPQVTRIGGDDELDRAAHTISSWPDLLGRHGWTLTRGDGTSDGSQWRHPTTTNKTSATIKHGCLFVYSPTPGLPVTEPGDPHGITLFSGLELLDYNGDRHALLRALRAAGALPDHNPVSWIPPELRTAPANVDPTTGELTRPDLEEPAGLPGRLYLGTSLNDQDLGEDQPLIDGLIDRGAHTVLVAPRKMGKSWLAMQIAHAVATGHGTVLGLPVAAQANVLFCHGELTDRAVQTRWRLQQPAEPGLPNLHNWMRGWNLKIRKHRTFIDGDLVDYHRPAIDGPLDQLLADHQIGLLVIDPWASYFAGSENSNDETEAALGLLSDLASRHNLATLIVHHPSKVRDVREPEDMWRGASRLPDWADTLVTLVPYWHTQPNKALEHGLDRQQARQYGRLHITRRSTPTADRTVRRTTNLRWVLWDPDTEGIGGQPVDDPDHPGRWGGKTADQILTAIDELGTQASRPKIADRLGISGRQITQALKHLERTGQATNDGPPINGHATWRTVPTNITDSDHE